jgi:hypothetical protein
MLGAKRLGESKLEGRPSDAVMPPPAISFAYTFDSSNRDAPSTHTTYYFERLGGFRRQIGKSASRQPLAPRRRKQRCASEPNANRSTSA